MTLALGEIDLFRNLGRAIATCLQIADLPQQFDRGLLAACDVFHQAHEEAVFPAGIDDYRRDFRCPQRRIRLKAALPADEVVGLPAS